MRRCTYKSGTLKQGRMNDRGIEFDWDEANIGHVARHRVLPEEAEQAVLNDPVDLGIQVVAREDRYVISGPRQRAAFSLS